MKQSRFEVYDASLLTRPMTEQMVAMYCFIDDLLAAIRPAWAPAPDPR
ncbi:hypothetical protein SAMN00120144_3208 [Hymenobacter roseosalivarius DSM 11622]|uniref:Uncharacterized protein n=1 Tax=Hymenobacter roseosalivarius DSM 11622 TaxID=645990 RepID=A0A1W1W2W6_9BACT|nr:hypothetical protein [Hymenobacter roseosalivarius]SMB99955.1 hypothetical protein SAMN00120144_3208 [Hymenobacter roseosalivarius DSM 11622]